MMLKAMVTFGMHPYSNPMVFVVRDQMIVGGIHIAKLALWPLNNNFPSSDYKMQVQPNCKNKYIQIQIIINIKIENSAHYKLTLGHTMHAYHSRAPVAVFHGHDDYILYIDHLCCTNIM